MQHLAAVGYSGSESVVIAIYPPELGMRCYHRVYDADDIDWLELEQFVRKNPNYSIGFVVNPGGTKIGQIRECRAHYFEFDDIPDKATQLTSWRDYDLPQPTLQIDTGGKSVHQYYRLVQGDDPTIWRKRQERLLHDLLLKKSDNSLVKQNQVLRLAGTWHPATRQMARIVSCTGEMFTPEQIEACLPALQEPEKVVPLMSPRAHDPDAARERYLSALDHVPGRGKRGDGGYTNAFRVLCALVKEFGPADAEAIAERWSPSDPRNGWDIPAKIRSILEMGQIRSDGGTIVGIARENGWQDPWQRRMVQTPSERPARPLTPPPAANDDEEEAEEDFSDGPSTYALSRMHKDSDYLPLVLHHVFDWPKTPWACVGDKLHRWCGTHYELMDDGQLTPYLTRFLGILTVVSNSGVGQATHPWARPKYVKESLDWFRHTLGTRKANPPNAINCRNGVVSWSWDGDELLVSFEPHSPEQVFTYVTGYDYNPDVDREPINQLLAALNDGQRTTIQRALGSSLDLPKYRSRRGRPRALLMLGGGSNGKDTLRTVMQAALGDRKATICSMSDFRQYDLGRKFPLAPLRDSSLNWPSENTEFVSVDDLQSVKAAISGDPLSWEVKGAQEESFIPSCLLVFNCNKPPLLSGADEAVRTRWYVCEFSKTFTSTPTKPDELLADPRFKDDPDFVNRELAPAFLMWLLEGLQAAVRHGIDYSSGGTAMTRIRALSCHLWEFSEAVNLNPDPHGHVVVSVLYEMLKQWYVTEGVLDSNGRWAEGALRDKPVKAARCLVDRLKAVFPTICVNKDPLTRRAVIHGLRIG